MRGFAWFTERMTKRNVLILVVTVLLGGIYLFLNRDDGVTPANGDDGIIVNVGGGAQVSTDGAEGAVLQPPALP